MAERIDPQRDVYQRNNDTCLKSYLTKEGITEENKKILQGLYDWILSNNLSSIRAIRAVYDVGAYIAKGRKTSLRDLSEKDVREIVLRINRLDKSEWTKFSLRLSLKRLFQYMKDYPLEKVPKEVEWVKLGGKTKKKILPDELLTQQEILRLIDAADNFRDKAFISLIYEAGLRIGEILTMQVKHVSFTQDGNYIMVPSTGKTGSRRVVVRDCVPLLAQYLNTHPSKNNPNSPLWTTIIGKKRPFSYAAARKMLKETAKAANIRKRVNPHSFRHASASNLATTVPESILKAYFGWTGDSDMPATYIHLSGRQVDKEILKARGVNIKEEEKKNVFEPIKCPNCDADNLPNTKYCMVCSFALDEKIRDAHEREKNLAFTVINALKNNPEALKMLGEAIQNSKDKELIDVVKSQGITLKKKG